MTRAIRRIVLISMCLALMGAVIPAYSTVLDFDEMTASGGMPASYHGIQWWYTLWMHFDYGQPLAHSGTQVVFGPGEASPSFAFDTPSVLNGAWFAGDSGQTVGFALYDSGGNLLHMSGSMALTGTSTFLESGYSQPVKRVSLVLGNGLGHFAMDDLTFNAVPEPTSLLALGAGLMSLAGLVGGRRRKARQ